MARPRQAAKRRGKRHELLADSSGLRLPLPGLWRTPAPARGLHAVRAFHPDRIGDDLERLFRRSGAYLGVLLCQCAGCGQGRAQPAVPQARRVVHLRVSRLTALYSVLLRLLLFPDAQAILSDLRTLHRRVAWCSGRALPQHLGLFRGNLLWRATLDSQGRCRGGGCLWLLWLAALSPDHLANDDASGLACLHKRGDLSLPRHGACLLLGFSDMATTR